MQACTAEVLRPIAMSEYPKVTVVDYGIGNLLNLKRALEYVGGKVEVTSDLEKISLAERLVLSGVGAFGKSMEYLIESGIADAISRFAQKERPLLGICLGMQILMSKSYEHGLSKGLDLIKGEVVRLDDPVPDGATFKIPHIGWERLKLYKSAVAEKSVLRRIDENDYFYFVHSYYAALDNDEYVLAKTEYGRNRFCSVLAKDNIYGCQFHPEKSGRKGLEILREFIFNA